MSEISKLRERAIAEYISKNDAFELALSAEPDVLGAWASKHLAAARYDSEVTRLVALMFQRRLLEEVNKKTSWGKLEQDIDWKEVKSELMLKKVKDA